MKFFINYFRACRSLGTGENSVSQLGLGKVMELIEVIIIAMLFAFMFTLESDLSFYYMDIALYVSAYAAFVVYALSTRWCKYKFSAILPSNYKTRAAGEYYNGLMFFFWSFAEICLILFLPSILGLFIDAKQMFIDLNQNGVEVAFKIALCLWLVANGSVSGKISDFSKRAIYDLIFILVTLGMCLLIKNAANGFTQFTILGNVTAMFSTIPNAVLWLVPAYTVSLTALAISVFITLSREKPKDY